jgi:two-component system nitrogen regulation sensor histidine kinase GlnL
MKTYSFTVDRSLRIRSWSEDLKMLTGTDTAQAIGRRYTDLFPRIFMNDNDTEAVKEVFKRQRTVNLKHRQFQCLSRHRQADIRLVPVKKQDKTMSRVQIDMTPFEPCGIGQQSIDSQRLIGIGKIAATLAHGVRNPLNAIKGAVVYLRDRYEHEEPLLEFTDILVSEISRLENFISNFLSTTTFDGDTALVDVNNLIKKIKVLVSLQTSARDIRCDYVLGEVPPIEISAFHLEQAILNVVNNALEAMQTGGTLTIRTSVKHSSSPPPFLSIEISDTGSGPNMPSRPAVREPGSQGRGFGLFIADEIVKYFKGQLQISGEKGKGTTVTFLLPIQASRKDGNSR